MLERRKQTAKSFIEVDRAHYIELQGVIFLKKSLAIIVTFILVLSMALPNLALAHSGRTDSSGGHNCSGSLRQKGCALVTIIITVDLVVQDRVHPVLQAQVPLPK